METLHGLKVIKIKTRHRSWWLIGGLAVLLLAISGGLMYLIVTGQTRRTPDNIASATSTQSTTTTTTVELVPRRLDGVLVNLGEESFAPRAIMVDNQIEARPISGISLANVAIESPVEGGITRFMLLFDATTTVDEVGPVRSARPYFVEWAQGWNAAYFHVGGSPEALDKLSHMMASSSIVNIDEMAHGNYFWRTSSRLAPHQVLTKKQWMDQATADYAPGGAIMPIAWQFKDGASSTERGDGVTAKISYGGSYTVSWTYSKDDNVYTRNQSGRIQLDSANDLQVHADNVVVIKTDATVLDDKGRLKLRTTGGGEALLYRDGRKYPIRWHRVANEPIKFSATDGSDVLFNRGKTWIEVTTDSRVFAGV